MTYNKFFLMPKNKIQFLNQIDSKVNDIAGEFIKTAITKSAGIIVLGNTRFTVDSTSGFYAGDEVCLDDRTTNSKFTNISSVLDQTNIEVEGDFGSMPSGTVIKKTSAAEYLSEALVVYSKYRPHENIETGNLPEGSNIINLPDGWQAAFSTINFFEYPAGSIPPVLLDEKDFEIFMDDDQTYKLRFAFPLTGAYKFSYSTTHGFDNSNPPISGTPDTDFYCVCNIAAGIYLLALASRWGESLNPAVGADSVDYNSKTDQYRRLAKELFGQAASWLGIDISELDGSGLEQSPFSCSQKIESANSDDGITLFHNRNINVIDK